MSDKFSYEYLLSCAINKQEEFERLIRTEQFSNLSNFHRMSLIDVYLEDVSLFSSIFSDDPDYDVYIQWYGRSYCKERQNVLL
jgi:hypothetical protein